MVWRIKMFLLHNIKHRLLFNHCLIILRVNNKDVYWLLYLKFLGTKIAI